MGSTLSCHCLDIIQLILICGMPFVLLDSGMFGYFFISHKFIFTLVWKWFSYVFVFFSPFFFILLCAETHN